MEPRFKVLLGPKVLGAALAALLMVSASGASAQGVIIDQGGVRIVPPGYDRGPPPPQRGYRGDDWERGVGPREARRIARRAGIVETYDIDRRGPTWVVNGADRRGRDIRVTISARTGEIVDVRRRGRG